MHSFDIRRIVADLQKLDKAGDRPVVRLFPRKPKAVDAKKGEPIDDLAASSI